VIVEAWISREWLVRNPYTAHWVQSYEADVNSPAYWTEVGEKLSINVFPADPGNAAGLPASPFRTDNWA
jgi:hypothetical protein